MDHEALTRTVIGCAMPVHSVLGPGFLESVYQNALLVELRGVGLRFLGGRALRVHYRGEVVGDFVADVVVEGRVLVENKAVRALTPAHDAQLVNYLVATGIDVGLLLNFGAGSLQFRRKQRVLKCDGPAGAGKTLDGITGFAGLTGLSSSSQDQLGPTEPNPVNPANPVIPSNARRTPV